MLRTHKDKIRVRARCPAVLTKRNAKRLYINIRTTLPALTDGCIYYHVRWCLGGYPSVMPKNIIFMTSVGDDYHIYENSNTAAWFSILLTVSEWKCVFVRWSISSTPKISTLPHKQQFAHICSTFDDLLAEFGHTSPILLHIHAPFILLPRLARSRINYFIHMKADGLWRPDTKTTNSNYQNNSAQSREQHTHIVEHEQIYIKHSLKDFAAFVSAGHIESMSFRHAINFFAHFARITGPNRMHANAKEGRDGVKKKLLQFPSGRLRPIPIPECACRKSSRPSSGDDHQRCTLAVVYLWMVCVVVGCVCTVFNGACRCHI